MTAYMARWPRIRPTDGIRGPSCGLTDVSELIGPTVLLISIITRIPLTKILTDKKSGLKCYVLEETKRLVWLFSSSPSFVSID